MRKLLFFVLVFIGATWAIDPGGCGALNSANTTYTLTASALINGSDCFTMAVSNVTLDCAGFSVIDNGTTTTNGVYSTNQLNTIKNCNISGFSSGIYIRGTAAHTISYNNISNCRSYCLQLRDTWNSTIENNIFNTSVSSANDIYSYKITTICRINTFANNTLIYGGTSGAFSTNNCFNETVRNNTFIVTGSSNYVSWSSAAGNGWQFYWNNFSGIPSAGNYYVVDTVGGNSYNSTAPGQNEGNIWGVINTSTTSYDVYGTGNNSTGFPSLRVGTAGSDYPFGNNSVFSCNLAGCFDYAPLTPNTASVPLICGRTLPSANRLYTLTQNLSINGSTCITFGQANQTLECSGLSITGNGTASTYGVYTTKTNTTIRNCNVSNFSEGLYSNGGNYLTALSNNFSANTAHGIYLSATSYATVANNIVNSSIASSIAMGMQTATCQYNRIENNTFYYSANLYSFETSSCTNITFRNNTLSSSSSNTDRLRWTSAVGGGWQIFLNNFTGSGTGAYVVDTIGTNTYYSTTAQGERAGNFYANVLNGSVNITGSVNSTSFPSYYIGTNGTGYPYNNVTSLGKFSCNFAGCNDPSPMTIVGGATATTPTVNASMNITPAQLYTHFSNTALRCTGYNLDGGNLTYNWTLYKNGTVNLTGTAADYLEGTTRNVVNITDTTIGNVWTLECRVNNSVGSSVVNLTSTMLQGCKTFSSTVGESLNLTNNITIYGSTCFTFNATSQTLDCVGFSIIGNNTASTSAFSVKTTPTNTTTKNCVIVNYPAPWDGMVLWNNAIFSNITAVYTSSGSFGGQNVTIMNSNLTTTGVNAPIQFGTTAPQATITGNKISSQTTGPCIILQTLANNTVITNNTCITGGSGIDSQGTGGLHTIANNTITVSCTSSTAGAIRISGSTSTRNTIYNNTLISTAGIGCNAFYASATSGNALLYWNNITCTGTSLCIRDLNGTNSYNFTINGQNEGNLYANIINGSIVATSNGLRSKGYPSLYVAVAGAGVPYTNTSSGGKFVCSFAGCGDYAPITNQYSPVALPNTFSGYFGYEFSTPAETLNLTTYETNYKYELYGFPIDYVDWNVSSVKDGINASFAYSRPSYIVFDYSKVTNYTANLTDAVAKINANFSDLNIHLYSTAVRFFVIKTNASATGDRQTFLNGISSALMGLTENRKRVYAYGLTFESPTVSEMFDVPINLTGTSEANYTLAEKTKIQTSDSVTRIYIGENATMQNKSKNFYTNVIRNLRANPSGNNSHPDSKCAYISNGDVVCFSTGAGDNYNFNLTASATGGKGAFDPSNGRFYIPLQTGNSSIYVGTYTAVPLLIGVYDKIVITAPTASSLYTSTTSTATSMNYQQNSTADGSFSIVGDNEARAELWSPDLGFSRQMFITYDMLEYTQIVDFTPYNIIVVAKGTNTPAIVNASLKASTNPSILNKTFMYMAVADYNNTNSSGDNETNCSKVNPWETSKIAEAANITQNYSLNVFIDGFDIGYATTPDCFEQRVKRVGDTIRAVNKSQIYNTYTIYQTVAHYGDYLMRESCFSRWGNNVSEPNYTYEDWSLMVANAQFEASYQMPVICMAFGDVNDYDKLMWDYHAFAVLYGTTNNYFRYGQPNFQTPREIRVPDFGSMMQIDYLNTSATDWTRRYANGVVHIDPTRTTPFANGKYYWFDNGEVVNSLQTNTTHQIYAAACNASHNSILKVNNGTTYEVDECTDVSTTQWTATEVLKNITSSYNLSGHYYLEYYAKDRTNETGLNLFNRGSTQAGVHSWYDSSATNPPVSEAEWTSYGRSGTLADFNTTNWKVSINLNKTTAPSIATGITTITAGEVLPKVWSGTTIIWNYSIYSANVVNITVISPLYNTAFDMLNSIKYNGTALNWSYKTDCTGTTPTFNYTTIGGEQHGVCVQNVSGLINIMFSVPHLSNQSYVLNATGVPLDTCTCPGSGTWSSLYQDMCTLSTMCSVDEFDLTGDCGTFTVASGGYLDTATCKFYPTALLQCSSFVVNMGGGTRCQVWN